MTLPEPRPTTMDGQPGPNLNDDILAAAVEHSIAQARATGTTPHTVIGNTPAVPQPGRTPMSQKATDDSVKMLCAGGMTLLAGGGISVVLVASDAANPIAIGAFFGGVGFVFLAVKSLVKTVNRSAPKETHHHYNAPVRYDQRQTTNQTRGVWAKTDNRTKGPRL